MKISINKYNSPVCGDTGARIDYSILSSIVEALELPIEFKLAPSEMRTDDWRLAQEYECEANRKPLLQLMRKHRTDLKEIDLTIESVVSATTENTTQIVSAWSFADCE